ncbi:hypothetical protein WMY93_031179 [Mugilogobius chulae]|uniref:Uncharacterized protein n=1 Tax=Mugilogobius chulae TaxID=88201 RepID=A0AAW0MDV7_9GOBI
MNDCSAIVAELKSQKQEFKTLKAQISETQSQISDMQSSLERQLTSKVERLECLISQNRDELKAELDRTAKKIQESFDLDVSQMSARIDNLEQKLEDAKRPTVHFNPDVSLIVAGLVFIEGEDVMARIKTLLEEGLGCEPVPGAISVERMTSRGRGPGIIKVELKSVEEKVAVLRRKQRLRDNDTYKYVYINSAKSHAERLVDLNFRTLLKELPLGKEFILARNGRLLRRSQADDITVRSGRSSPHQRHNTGSHSKVHKQRETTRLAGSGQANPGEEGGAEVQASVVRPTSLEQQRSETVTLPERGVGQGTTSE